jgi:hypothetical protein
MIGYCTACIFLVWQFPVDFSNRAGKGMMENTDLWRLATMLIQKHGESAQMYACIRADEAASLGKNRAHRTWKTVAAAVSELETIKSVH